MKINKIQNAYIKNKPNYNYQINDEDGNYIASGHLLNSRQKQMIMKHISTTIDKDGNAIPTMDSYVDFSASWIVMSIDKWIISQVVTKQIIQNLEQQVIVWLVQQIRLKNEQSLQVVQTNEKN